MTIHRPRFSRKRNASLSKVNHKQNESLSKVNRSREVLQCNT